MSDGFRIDVASPPDREKLVAEVFFDDEQIAEINQETAELQIEIYPRPSGTPWVLSCGDFLAALNQAKQRLVGAR